MNSVLQEALDPQRLRFEADLAARLDALFQRCPTLCGFSVQAGDLVDLTCHPMPDGECAQAVLGEVSQMLFDLVDEQPEAAELLCGRTFARTVH